ncbi:MAG: LamG domain-containing protein [bacterium]|nr:LamG domain-containing protein [bacterium]
MRKYTLIFILLFTVSVYAAGPHGCDNGWVIDNSVPPNILFNDTKAQRFVSAGAGWIRVELRLAGYANWNAELLSKYSTVFATAKKYGIQVIGLIDYSSVPGSWTQADWCANNYEHTGGDGNNAYIQAYTETAASLISTYRNQVAIWEIWNEPNCWTNSSAGGYYWGGFYIYPSNFAAMLYSVSSAVKLAKGWNDITILSGGLFGHAIGDIYSADNAGATYLRNVYSMGINHNHWTVYKTLTGTYPLDLIGQHIYIDQGTTTTAAQLHNYLAWVYSAYTTYEGITTNKKIVITEVGWTTSYVDTTVQATNVNLSYLTFNDTPFVQTAIWFQLEDNPAGGMYYGILDSSGNKKSAWSYYSTLCSYEGRDPNLNINTSILQWFTQNGGQPNLGSPINSIGSTAYVFWYDYGYAQTFAGGTQLRCAIMSSTSGTFLVTSTFLQTYIQSTNRFLLGFPTSTAYTYAGGLRQNFQGGYLYYSTISGMTLYDTPVGIVPKPPKPAMQVGLANEYQADTATILIWHCNEMTGTTAYDSSGNNRHGTITGSVLKGITSATSLRYCFDGFGDSRYLSRSNSDTFASRSTFTIEAWVTSPWIFYDYETIAELRSAGTISWMLCVMHDGAIRLETGTPANSIQTAPLVWSMDTWYHIAAVVQYLNTTTNRIQLYWTKLGYIIPNLVADTTVALITPGTNSMTFRVGADAISGQNRYYQARIDELRFSDIARQPAEFTTLSSYQTPVRFSCFTAEK